MLREPDGNLVLWALRNGHRRLECSVQLLPQGLQLHMALDTDTPYFSRSFQAQDELLAGTCVSTCRTTVNRGVGLS